VTIVDAQTGVEAEPIIVDRATGRPNSRARIRVGAGPAAGQRTRQRYARRPQPGTRPAGAETDQHIFERGAQMRLAEKA